MKKDCSGAAYLIKLVHVIGQQVDDLARGSLAHGHVTKAECLKVREGKRISPNADTK